MRQVVEPMFTQASVNQLVDNNGRFVLGPNGMNMNWGMYTVADILQLLAWHEEYSPNTRSEARHIRLWLEYHGVALSWYFYDEGFDAESTTYPDHSRVTRTNIAQATMRNPLDDVPNLRAERHYCERSNYWLNRALKFLYVNPTPIKE